MFVRIHTIQIFYVCSKAAPTTQFRNLIKVVIFLVDNQKVLVHTKNA